MLYPVHIHLWLLSPSELVTEAVKFAPSFTVVVWVGEPWGLTTEIVYLLLAVVKEAVMLWSAATFVKV